MRQRFYSIAKRAFDVAGSLSGLILASPLLVCIAVLIKLGSPGPVFYRGVRTGQYGRPFRIFKFRTMVAEAEQIGSVTTSENDQRITGIGALLRKHKLDELPQLINVLVGNMSFVGPRPEVVKYTELYTDDERIILSVRPGITDWASIQFSDLQAVVGDHDAERMYCERVLPRKTELRMKYVRERSFAADARILAQTIWTIVNRPLRRS